MDHSTAPPSDPLRVDTGPDALLVAEFGYIAQTAFQANEDRARVSNFFLVTAAAVLGAVIGLQLDATFQVWVFRAFWLVFSVLIALGWLTILQLARLRAAWFESVRAMDQLKSYVQWRYPDAQLDYAFAWRLQTAPRRLKLRSVAWLMAVSVFVVNWALTIGWTALLQLSLFPDAYKSRALLIGVALGVALGFALTVFEILTYILFLRE